MMLEKDRGKKMIVIVTLFTVLPGKTDTLMKEVEPLIKAMRRESGCIKYIFNHNINNIDNFAFIEHWEDQASVDAHIRSDHLKQLKQSARS
jgi:quinol monooxygenase YgiN